MEKIVKPLQAEGRCVPMDSEIVQDLNGECERQCIRLAEAILPWMLKEKVVTKMEL